MQLVRFFDAYPGGCAAPLPGMVRAIAAALDGAEGNLDVAVQEIVRAAGGNPYRAQARDGAILLYDGPPDLPLKFDGARTLNCWRVLRYASNAPAGESCE